MDPAELLIDLLAFFPRTPQEAWEAAIARGLLPADFTLEHVRQDGGIYRTRPYARDWLREGTVEPLAELARRGVHLHFWSKTSLHTGLPEAVRMRGVRIEVLTNHKA